MVVNLREIYHLVKTEQSPKSQERLVKDFQLRYAKAADVAEQVHSLVGGELKIPGARRFGPREGGGECPADAGHGRPDDDAARAAAAGAARSAATRRPAGEARQGSQHRGQSAEQQHPGRCAARQNGGDRQGDQDPGCGQRRRRAADGWGDEDSGLPAGVARSRNSGQDVGRDGQLEPHGASRRMPRTV